MPASNITPEVRASVLRRDGYRCIAPEIDGSADCLDTWGHRITRWPPVDRGPTFVQMSHTKVEGELSMGKKATNDRYHLVTLCPWHHLGMKGGSNWEAVHRDAIRRYINDIEGLT